MKDRLIASFILVATAIMMTGAGRPLTGRAASSSLPITLAPEQPYRIQCAEGRLIIQPETSGSLIAHCRTDATATPPTSIPTPTPTAPATPSPSSLPTVSPASTPTVAPSSTPTVTPTSGAAPCPAGTLATCAATGGVVSDGGRTCTWRDRLTIDPQRVTASGWQQFRFRGFVREPDGTEMRTSTGLYAYVANGKAVTNAYQIGGTYDVVETRGWYTGTNYANVALFDPPLEPVSGIWRPQVRFYAGSGGIRVTGWYAAIDTDFHNHNPGIPVGQGNSECRPCTLTIDTTTLSNGWHRLFLRTDQFFAQDGHTNSGVLATWFFVHNP